MVLLWTIAILHKLCFLYYIATGWLMLVAYFGM